jgi:hypothetical protein
VGAALPAGWTPLAVDVHRADEPSCRRCCFTQLALATRETFLTGAGQPSPPRPPRLPRPTAAPGAAPLSRRATRSLCVGPPRSCVDSVHRLRMAWSLATGSRTHTPESVQGATRGTMPRSDRPSGVASTTSAPAAGQPSQTTVQNLPCGPKFLRSHPVQRSQKLKCNASTVLNRLCAAAPTASYISRVKSTQRRRDGTRPALESHHTGGQGRPRQTQAY